MPIWLISSQNLPIGNKEKDKMNFVNILFIAYFRLKTTFNCSQKLKTQISKRENFFFCNYKRKRTKLKCFPFLKKNK